MSDLELILLILAGIYLAECTLWLRPGLAAFVSQLGGRHRWRTLSSGGLVNARRGGLVFGHFLPWGDTLRCGQWLLSLAPDGVYAGVRQAPLEEDRRDQTDAYFPWQGMQAIEPEGSNVLINGQLFLQAGSPALARQLVKLLGFLKAKPGGDLVPTIDQALAHSLDIAEIERRYCKTWDAARLLRFTCGMLFAFLFIYCPLLVALELPLRALDLFLLYGALLAMTMAHFWLIHRRLKPQATAERGQKLAVMLLSPADAVHARAHLFRDLLAPFHPLAVAAVLCPRPQFVELARWTWLDLCHPLASDCPPDQAPGRQAEDWFHARLTQAVETFIRQQGIDPTQFLTPPQPEQARCRSYCPRCRGQFELEVGTCHTCQLPLRTMAGEDLVSVGKEEQVADGK